MVPYSPLARGLLTGKYASRRRRRRRTPAPAARTGACWNPNGAPKASPSPRRSPRTPRSRGLTPGQFAFAWVLNNRLVTAAIGGPRTEDQWEDYAGALTYRFTPADEALVDRLVTTGHASSPRYNDPAYPIEGRAPRTAPAG